MRVLITGGSSWIKIDDVRILTNIFTGRTSLFLARYFLKKKSKVTLIINDHCVKELPKGLKVISFRYFNELKKALIRELKANSYDLIIHAAAVSDYELRKVFPGKISSGKRKMILKFIPTPKLTKTVRHLAKNSVLVQFKLEISRLGLLEKAHNSLARSGFDFVVANAWKDLESGYQAFILDRNGNVKEVNSRNSLALNLFNLAK